MRSACLHVQRMGMIQIRNVPDDLHRRLKARAAKEGMSLSDYMLSELQFIADRPTMEEIDERLKSLPPVQLSKSAAELVREDRDGR